MKAFFSIPSTLSFILVFSTLQRNDMLKTRKKQKGRYIKNNWFDLMGLLARYFVPIGCALMGLEFTPWSYKYWRGCVYWMRSSKLNAWIYQYKIFIKVYLVLEEESGSFILTKILLSINLHPPSYLIFCLIIATLKYFSFDYFYVGWY